MIVLDPCGDVYPPIHPLYISDDGQASLPLSPPSRLLVAPLRPQEAQEIPEEIRQSLSGTGGVLHLTISFR
jgi:hypothetical protein